MDTIAALADLTKRRAALVSELEKIDAQLNEARSLLKIAQPRLHKPSLNITTQPGKIVAFLRERGPSNFGTICTSTGVPTGTAGTIFSRLVAASMIRKVRRGVYEAIS